jgi:phosphoesterase RecJ-like protein
MSQADSIAALLSLIRERQSFLITSHARPDGDAIGSSVGLMHLLDAMGKDVHVIFSDPIPQIYGYLPGVKRIKHTLPATAPDAAILLECDTIERSGFKRIDAGMTMNIDHHKSGRHFADFNWIDPEASAVGAMIYDLAVASDVQISAALATCLYTAVLTDTGSFTYSATTAKTFALAEHLVASGANACEVAEAVYFSNPPSKMRVLGLALNNMVLDGEVAHTWITQQEMARAGAVPEDCEGIVNYLIGIAGIETAAFLREVFAPSGEVEFRTSLRSKGSVDVSLVAERFGGGGHRNASGCTLADPLEAAQALVVSELHAAIRKNRAAGNMDKKAQPV